MLLKVDQQFGIDMAKLGVEDKKLAYKVWDLVLDILKTPFSGIGKPEALKGDMSGYWSRRINQKHRLIYKVTETTVFLVSCYGHYDDN